MANKKGDVFTWDSTQVGKAKPKKGAGKSVKNAVNNLNAKYGGTKGKGKK